MSADAPRTSALDVLGREDALLLSFFEELDRNRGPDVEERSRYGNLVKQLIRHVSVREAALVDVTRHLRASHELEGIVDHMESDTKSRREALDRVEHMSRGVPLMSLNHGQDFDGRLRDLEDLLRPDINYDLESALPAIRQAEDHGDVASFHSAHYVERHAPTSLSPEGSKWYERAPVISRVFTVFDHLRDYPRSARDQRI